MTGKLVPKAVREKGKEEEEELEGSAMVEGVTEEMEEGGRMVMGRILVVAFVPAPAVTLLENVKPPSFDTLIPQCPEENPEGNGQITLPTPPSPSPMTASGDEVPINTGAVPPLPLPPLPFHHPQVTFPPPPPCAIKDRADTVKSRGCWVVEVTSISATKGCTARGKGRGI